MPVGVLLKVAFSCRHIERGSQEAKQQTDLAGFVGRRCLRPVVAASDEEEDERQHDGEEGQIAEVRPDAGPMIALASDHDSPTFVLFRS